MNVEKQIIDLDIQSLSKDPIMLCNQCLAKNIPLNCTLKIIGLSVLSEKINESGLKADRMFKRFKREELMYKHRWRLIQELNGFERRKYTNTVQKKQLKRSEK